MEAALRSAYYLVTGENTEPDAFKAVRGPQGWKEASFDLPGRTLKCAVAHGLGNARRLIEALKDGSVQYDFVEVMACPGGCAGGGGQPICEDSDDHSGAHSEPLRPGCSGSRSGFPMKTHRSRLYTRTSWASQFETAHHLRIPIRRNEDERRQVKSKDERAPAAAV